MRPDGVERVLRFEGDRVVSPGGLRAISNK
jgi:hypothetical protein